MLKATDLQERSVEDLRELEKTLTRDVFQNRFKNFTNRLDDTSTIKKAKKDLARVKTVLTQRVKSAVSATAAAEPAAVVAAPKVKAKSAAAPKAAKAAKVASPAAEKPAAAKKTATKKTAKKSEAE
jgi:large subunit ribosomal protein L29